MACESENRRCLPSAGGAIEEEMREAIGFDEFVNWTRS